MTATIRIDSVKKHLSDVGLDLSRFKSDNEMLTTHETLQRAGVFDKYYSCSRKTVYETMALATRASYYQDVISASRNPGIRVKKGFTYIPYKCRFCYGYHIGHVKGK